MRNSKNKQFYFKRFRVQCTKSSEIDIYNCFTKYIKSMFVISARDTNKIHVG